MAVRLNKVSSGSRTQVGATVLAAAHLADTRLVKERLDRFQQAHEAYAAAQQQVETVEAELTARQAEFVTLDAAQDLAVDALLRALVFEGHPPRDPFAAFGDLKPSALQRSQPVAKAASIHDLVANVLRDASVGAATRKAAQAADAAAAAVERAVSPIAEIEHGVRAARGRRDTVAQVWDEALGGLRRGARAARDEGAPELYGLLFRGVARSARKAKPSADTPVDGPPPTTGTSNAA